MLLFKQALSQIKLSELTGIPRRHIAEMENGKRSTGKKEHSEAGGSSERQQL
ncbi:helix-turn-helix domain-containing protein [Desulfonema ishimotonii]|uniref:helix-turn-helix domain-containing protein n=1 Tax=Desulfonema ishimotonii TaxID=45657 RepID=UPI000F56739F|nr:helix-turn-helix domain-containing protein [Desulfonema ishimotonii]